MVTWRGERPMRVPTKAKDHQWASPLMIKSVKGRNDKGIFQIYDREVVEREWCTHKLKATFN